MDKKRFSSPFSVKNVNVTDEFWKHQMELVRTEVIPYQWDALNDQVVGALPSFCMHNFKAAVKLNKEREEKGGEFETPIFTYRGFEALPEDPKNLDDKFYGFVFQDSDFYKWIEAVAYSLANYPDVKLEQIADDAIDIVCAAQQEDGYLNTFYILNGMDQIFTNLRDFHELYCFGHLAEGAVAYYQATGKRKLLDATCKFANYLDDYFGAAGGKCKGYPGHEIAEMALVRLYEVTGEKRYLNLGKYFVDERGKRPYYFDGEHPKDIANAIEDLRYEYHQAHVPVREQDEVVGHAVRAVYLYAGMADVARLTDDKELFSACEKLWNNMAAKKLYITGGIGGTHIGEAFSYNYDLPNDTAYAETCASIGLVFWARRMLEMNPNSKYADVMELALYNGVLAGMALDGKSFFYVNPLEVNPEACHKDERIAHVKPVRQKWFGCACCPPNLARIISSVNTYVFTEKEDVLYVHLYMSSEVQKAIGDETVTIRTKSSFPWAGKVSIDMSEVDTDFTLALRIPAWSNGYELKLDDSINREVKDGYLYLSGDWSKIECFAIDFPMEARVIQANPLVRENLGKVAVLHGPIVYCAEEVDNGKNLHLLSLDCDADAEMDLMQIEGNQLCHLTMPGYRIIVQEKGSLYYKAKAETEEKCEIKLVPYFAWGNRGENEMSVWLRKQHKEILHGVQG